MAVRRRAPIAAVFLVTSLAACNPNAAKTDDSKPPAAASSVGASASTGADPSAAPGAPADGSGLSLAEVGVAPL
ncbi:MULTISPECIES: hypothetical protein [unclassified Streptomyces]|uniref:hypothetical protein n=1 Tax=unclassified Streptomyces TaxID=2593676 RepID=UPI0035DA132B